MTRAITNEASVVIVAISSLSLFFKIVLMIAVSKPIPAIFNKMPIFILPPKPK